MCRDSHFEIVPNDSSWKLGIIPVIPKMTRKPASTRKIVSIYYLNRFLQV